MAVLEMESAMAIAMELIFLSSKTSEFVGFLSSCYSLYLPMIIGKVHKNGLVFWNGGGHMRMFI